MTSHSDLPPNRAGFTLFETMVSFVIVGLVLTVAISAIRAPSPSLLAASDASQLARDAVQQRADAISQQRTVIWAPDAQLCSNTADPVFRFFADGTARGPEICMPGKRLVLHPLTGYLQELAP